MGTAYHRRPRPTALDVATVAHCKIGNGSAWQGYYMYAGGTNPPGDHGMQESHATGYPNDLPRLGYDFHAPIGEAGVLAPSHAELRRQHAFLAAFGATLAGMPSSLPGVRPAGVEDTSTLRWALRADGDSGFLFVAWHQPHVPLAAYRDARFRVALGGTELVLPSRPIDIPPGTLARWPLHLTAGGVTLSWATASALTLLPGDVPTLVLTAEPGIAPELVTADGAVHRAAALSPLRLTSAGGALDVLVLDPESARTAWVCEDGGRRLLLCADELSWGPDGRIRVRTSDPAPAVRAYDPAARSFVDLSFAPEGPAAARVADAAVEELRPAGPAVPVAYGKHEGRPSAPSPSVFDELAAVYRVALPGWAADEGLDVLLDIGWAGDVAEVRVGGRTVTDRFWDGSRWTLSLRDAGHRPGDAVTLHVLPLAAGSTVHLPRDARDRLLAAGGQLLAVDDVRVAGLRTWHER
ncbi:hypothetical protein Asp14428_66260 [Actinoplanes sp. NBRC 14428]|nr:hypothetical protein Asp14428_66260 [Actinoplanes sp. NBRC 14428]